MPSLPHLGRVGNSLAPKKLASNASASRRSSSISASGAATSAASSAMGVAKSAVAVASSAVTAAGNLAADGVSAAGSAATAAGNLAMGSVSAAGDLVLRKPKRRSTAAQNIRSLPPLAPEASFSRGGTHLEPLGGHSDQSLDNRLHTHHPALCRWIFEEARHLHTERASYQARQLDASERLSPEMRSVVFREVLTDVWAATRNCYNAYHAAEVLAEAGPCHAAKRTKQEAKQKRMRRIRAKVLAAGTFCKLLSTLKKDNENAEAFWKQCFDGLGSCSITSAAFGIASRSLGLASYRKSPAPPAGSASMAVRMFRQLSRAKIDVDEKPHEPRAPKKKSKKVSRKWVPSLPGRRASAP